MWGYGILGQGPKVSSSRIPTLLPEPLFGANEFNDDVEVKQIACSLSHFAAVTSKLCYLNFKSKTQILLASVIIMIIKIVFKFITIFSLRFSFSSIWITNVLFSY